MNECTPGIQFLQPSSSTPSQTFSQYAPENLLESISEGSGSNPCGEIFPSEHNSQIHEGDLNIHVEGHHSNMQVYPCNPYVDTSPSTGNLQIHTSYVHENRDGPSHHANNVHTQEIPNKC